MIYKQIFDLIGTTKQVNIIKEGLDKIKFPWERITPPERVFKIGWQDLNNGLFAKARAHKGHGNEPVSITGKLNGRKYIMGVFYPHNGDIFVDNKLVNYPEIAQTTVSAEAAHLADEYLPLTDAQRLALHKLMHPGGIIPKDEAFWWEKIDYETEYFSLAGEFFMCLFTLAYSDMLFDASGFTHTIEPNLIPKVREIIGIERTDLVPATPLKEFKVIGTSKIYHKLSHYPAKSGKIVTNISKLTPCKTCKP